MFFNNKFNTFFGLNLTLVYTFPMCMTWRFHFPLCNYDFNNNNNRRQPCLRTLARVSICDCDRINECLINCQSICNKAITIKDYIVDNSLDIILLCETWLTSEKEKNICGDIVPAGFDIVCVNRGRRKGGGVALIHQKNNCPE